jgi:hypothetical protein
LKRVTTKFRSDCLSKWCSVFDINLVKRFIIHNRTLLRKTFYINSPVDNIIHQLQYKRPSVAVDGLSAYVKPRLVYASQLWSPITQHSILTVERVQRRFTKKLNDLYDLPYVQRLQLLDALLLQVERHVADITLIHKCIHGKTGYKPNEIGLNFSVNNSRSGKLRWNNVAMQTSCLMHCTELRGCGTASV